MDTPPVVLPIQLTPAQVRPIAYRIISKKHGLNLKSSALEVLSKFLGHHFGADWRSQRAEKSLDEISKRWKEEDRGIFVDGPPLLQVIKDYINAETATQNTDGSSQAFDWNQYFKVVNVKDQQRLLYDGSKKNFVLPTEVTGEADIPKLFGNASSLTNVFTTRYNILRDKLYRNDMFQPSSLASTSSGFIGIDDPHLQVFTITPIKNMLGRSVGSEFFLFGLLEKQADGPWTLYDSSSNISLEFTEESTFREDHYYTSGSFVICHGHFMGEYFQVVTMGVPPPEKREQSQVAYGNIDFYGLNSGKNTKKKISSRIERIDQSLHHILESEETKMADNRIVIFGTDIFLDKLPIVDALKKAFLKLEEDPPMAIVLPGSFISSPIQPHMNINNDGRNAAQIYRDGMNELAEIFNQCPEISSKTKIIMIPGPNDPWHSAAMTTSSSARLLPYNPLPSVFTGRVDRAVKEIEWATNPTRLCYLSQEIYMYRGDAGSMLRKYSLDIDAITQKNNRMEESEVTATIGSTQSIPFENDQVEERDADRAGTATMLQENEISIDELTARHANNDNTEFRRVMATLLDQCHISPFSLSNAPVIWEYDLAMSLSQWPTYFVLLDPSTPPAKQNYEGCHVMNPGPFFYNNKANWIEFWPSSGDCTFMDYS